MTGPGFSGFADAMQAQTVNQLVSAYLQKTPSPTDLDVAQLLKLVPINRWKDATRSLIEAGVPLNVAQTGIQLASDQTTSAIKSYLTVGAAAASAYHGVKRNDSLFWGACWFLFSLTFPIFGSAAALAQGFAKPKR